VKVADAALTGPSGPEQASVALAEGGVRVAWQVALATACTGAGQVRVGPFRLFEEAEVRCPVVFTTAYDAYVIEAFERNAIDYVLKPVQRERLAQALNKYVRLGEHYTGRLLASGAAAPGAGGIERVVARKGAAFVAVPVPRIAWFTTEHKLTILVDRGGGRLMVDTPLHELEERLDRRRFFRLNRQYLAQIDAIERFRSAGKGRVSVTLQPAAPDEVIVSQECAAAFRAWIGG
jgi:two-component system LytT family response regulator